MTILKSLHFPLVLLLLGACNGSQQNTTPDPGQPVSDEVGQQEMSAPERMVQAYTTAIAEYLKAVRQRDGSVPDTLLIGKHIDLPEIALPAVIQHTHIRILTQEAAEPMQHNTGFVYLNMIASFTADTAAFMIVTFDRGFAHKHDLRMELVYKADGGEFELVSLQFDHPFSDGPAGTNPQAR